ncbi:MAG: prepilin-type N-terminal cleavage/methylation domain-containing protein, partial [Dehalococcoidia bacterium]
MRGQRGFTVVELLLVVFIVGLVVPVVLTMVVQMSQGTKRINTEMVIQNEVDIASGWFSRDLSQARTTDVADDPDLSVDRMRVEWLD